MLTQLLAWTATVLGLVSTWLCGRHRCTGWLYGIASCTAWIVVNTRLHLWAGIAAAAIAACLSLRNWHRWQQPNVR